jgi:translation initiation factor 2B subunit (eIF-2B alpha/beta/delta family)/8-oxo-dGTP pyrophosphatase MutT (NUDIX family)
MDETDVVTGFLRNEGEILLLERSDAVGSYAGEWGGVAGHAEGDPDRAIEQEIREETGIDPEVSCTPVRSGDPFAVVDEDLDTRWRVHPYLFDCETRTVEPNYETTEYEWVSPTEILRRGTVPKLWGSYDAVRPRVEAIAADAEHGSAYISIRALEALRDESALLAERPERNEFGAPAAVARALLDARPSMTVVANRIHRAMAAAESQATLDVEGAARRTIQEAADADERAAMEAVPAVEGAVVATVSRSGTALQALGDGQPQTVVLPESRPGREGIEVAELLAEGTDVVLTSDAGFPHQIAEQDVDLLLVGADSITPDGAVINKVGTRAAAAASAHEDCRVVVVAASDKIRPSEQASGADSTIDFEPRERAELYDGDADIRVENPTFDVTPAELIDAVVTERGELNSGVVGKIATEHARRRSWR